MQPAASCVSSARPARPVLQLAGRFQRIPVGIERSASDPLEVPQLIEECFHELVGKAGTITDPFEQAFRDPLPVPAGRPDGTVQDISRKP